MMLPRNPSAEFSAQLLMATINNELLVFLYGQALKHENPVLLTAVADAMLARKLFVDFEIGIAKVLEGDTTALGQKTTFVTTLASYMRATRIDHLVAASGHMDRGDYTTAHNLLLRNKEASILAKCWEDYFEEKE